MEALGHLFTTVTNVLSPAAWVKTESRIDSNTNVSSMSFDDESKENYSENTSPSPKKRSPAKKSSPKKKAKSTKKTPAVAAKRAGKVKVKQESTRRSSRNRGKSKKGFYSENNLQQRAWSSGCGSSQDPFVL
jgi:hypothetical protein